MAKKPKKKGKKPSSLGKLGKKGRKTNGRFEKGHRHSVGNPGPTGSKAQKLRDAALAAVSVADIKAIIQKLVKQAKGGNIKAAKEVLDRCLGKPAEEVGGVNIPTSPNKVPIEEISQHYFLTLQKLPPLGGIDMKSIEGNKNGSNGNNKN